MKKVFFATILMTFSAFILGGNAMADSYGRVTITGLSVTDGNPDGFVVFTSAFDSAHHPEECLASDFWWPPGTTYAFWMPMDGNENHFKVYEASFLTGKKMWVMANQEYYGFGAGVDCKLVPITTQGNY